MPSPWRAHRLMFEAQVLREGVNVTVRQPASKTTSSNAADRVFGKQQIELGVGKATVVKALANVAGVVLADRDVPANIAAVGRAERIDYILRLKLSDTLSDADQKFARTIFDTAKDVLLDGVSFVVRATDRSGPMPEGPYILWVAIRKAGE